MKCLIYQYWTENPIPVGAEAGSENMQAYARMVGADYRFDRHQPFTNRFGVASRRFDKCRPAFDSSFWEYDRVLVVDLDIFVREGVKDNIFEVPLGDFGMCPEPDQPKMRLQASKDICGANDRAWERFVRSTWGIEVPPMKVYNAGLVLYSGDGMHKVRTAKPSIRHYVESTSAAGLPPFYGYDQNYLHAIGFAPGMRFTELSPEWNRQVHYIGPRSNPNRPVYDKRTPETKFIHVQLSGADNHDGAWHRRIVNQWSPVT